VPAVGALRSRHGKDICPVIIDEIMNAQSLLGSDTAGAEWHVMAHEHALDVARDFVRPDGSTYHSSSTTSHGNVRRKTTYQGTCGVHVARGQAGDLRALRGIPRDQMSGC